MLISFVKYVQCIILSQKVIMLCYVCRTQEGFYTARPKQVCEHAASFSTFLYGFGYPYLPQTWRTCYWWDGSNNSRNSVSIAISYTNIVVH